jgi:IS1 family transposase
MTIPALIFIRDLFFDEERCIKFLKEKKILREVKKCSICESHVYQEYRSYRCSNKECRKYISIFNDSFFFNRNIRCSELMFVGYLWLCKNKYTSIKMITVHSPETIVKYIELFRMLVIKSLRRDDMKIGGMNVIVEIDESKFKKNKDFWVIGGVERTTQKKCFFEVVKDRDVRTMRRVIRKHVKPGSIVHTDHWRGYGCVTMMPQYRHKRVNHSQGHVSRGTGVHTNNIEGLWNGVKINLSSRECDEDEIEMHLMEFIWRRKHRDDLWKGFLDALKKYKV